MNGFQRSPRVIGGQYRIAGTRLQAGFFWKLRDYGYTWINENYPSVTQEQIDASIAWGERRSQMAKRAAATRKAKP